MGEPGSYSGEPGSYSGEPSLEHDSSLGDVTRMSLSQLQNLDDVLLEESVGNLLGCSGAVNRRWDSPNRILI